MDSQWLWVMSPAAGAPLSHPATHILSCFVLPKAPENTRYKPNNTSRANLKPGSQVRVIYHKLKRQWLASQSRCLGTTSAAPRPAQLLDEE